MASPNTGRTPNWGTTGIATGGSGGHEFLYTRLLAEKALAQLYTQAVLMRLINYFDAGMFGLAKMTGGGAWPHAAGDEVDVRLPLNLVVGEGEDLDGTEAHENNLIERTAPITVQNMLHVAVKSIQRSDFTFHMDDNRFKDFVKTIGNTLAAECDRRITADMINNTYQFVGRTDIGISTYHFSAARALLNKVPAPMDQRYSILVDPDTEHVVRSALQGPIVQTSTTGSGAAHLEKIGALGLRRHYITDFLGLMFYQSHHIPKYTAGTYAGTPLLAAAATDGATSLTIDGWTALAGATLKKGALLTIGGAVRRVDLHSAKYPVAPFTVVVTDDVDLSSGGSVSVPIHPKIVYDTTDPNYNNVNMLPPDNAPVTVLGASGVEYDQAIMFHKRAMTYADVAIPFMGVDPDWDKPFTQRFGVPGGIHMSMRCLLNQMYRNPSMGFRVDSQWAWGMTERYLATRIIGKLPSTLKAEVPA